MKQSPYSLPWALFCFFCNDQQRLKALIVCNRILKHSLNFPFHMLALVCAHLTFLRFCGTAPLSAAPGGPLQKLLKVMFEYCCVQIITFTSKHTACPLSTVKVHKLPPAHCTTKGKTQRGCDYDSMHWTLVMVGSAMSEKFKVTGSEVEC